MDIQDPCGNEPGWDILVATYVGFLQYGVNYTNKDGLRAATLAGYAKAVNKLFTLRGFTPPVDLSDPDNPSGRKIMNHQKEEDIAVQRYPLNSEILAKLASSAALSHSIDSEKNLVFDMTCLGRFIGPRVSEYAQTSARKVDYHIYPSGTKVIKAFTADDFVFYDRSGHTLTLTDDASLNRAHKVKITWRIQKNRQNGQKITISGEKTCLTVCPVRAAGRMVLRARRLSQPGDMPVACYSYKGTQHYLTGTRIAQLFREAVKAIHPNTSKDDLSRYSAHSLRVWACVLLDEAGMSPDFIMARLRWMGNSFRMYLRDTGIIQDKHRDVLRAASQEIIDLIAGSSAQIPNMAGLSTVDVDNTMGEYIDDMD